MNRIAALLIVVAAYGLLAVGASAKGVKSKDVGQSRADVLNYWTPERMREAKPVPLAKGGKPDGGTTTKPGTATQVPFPYSGATLTNGKVFFSDGPYNYVCSGTALTSDNESVVWTAGHCVHEQGPGPEHFYSNWMFAPAYRNGDSPTYGRFAAQKLFTTDDWAQAGDFGDDLGAAYVGPDGSGTTLTDRVGGRILATGDAAPLRRYNSFGYPAEGSFNGQTLWMCDATANRRDTSVSPATIGMPCNLTGGSSGGGWVSPADGMVYSVNSYSYRSLKNVMFGPYQGVDAFALYTAAETFTP